MSSETTGSDIKQAYKTVQLGPREVTLPKEWEVCPVTELFEIQKKSFDPDSLSAESEVMLYSMPAYDSGKEPLQTPVSEVGSKKYHVPADTILFPKLNIRKRRFWRVRHDHDFPAICSTEYWPLLPKRSLVLDFYHYYFDSYEFTSNPKVTSSSSTNSHKRVKESSFEKIQLPFPPLSEQRRIADILSTIDEQIHQTDEMIERTEELKRGLMQDLLTQGIDHDTYEERYLGPQKIEVPEEWTKARLEDVSEIITRGKQPTYVDEGGVPVLNQSCIYWDGFHPEALKRLDEEVAAGWKDKYWVKEGDVLINSTGKGTLGRALEWTRESGTHALDSHITRVHPDKSVLDSTYFRFYLESNHGQKMLYAFCVAGSTGQIELSKSDLQTMPVLLPPVKEQRAISESFHRVNNKLQDEQETKAELQELKRGLMQDLLTGQVRVNPDN